MGKANPLQLKKACVCLAVALLLGQALPGLAQESRIPPAELVREVVAEELNEGNAPGHYMYLVHEVTPTGSTTKEMIETKNWLVGRLIRRNGRPLTPDQKRKEGERLRGLLTNPQALQKERLEQERGERLVRELFSAMPQAFEYEYAGSQSSAGGDELVRLKFRPNPGYDPPTRELRALGGMEGTMLIDATADRIVSVAGQLMKRVNFAWGILAHLDPGGTFLLEQRNVGPGRWHPTRLSLHFTGKILFFKTLDIDSARTASDFRKMPDNLTLEEGLELLREQDQMKGESRPKSAAGKNKETLGKKGARKAGELSQVPSSLLARDEKMVAQAAQMAHLFMTVDLHHSISARPGC